MTTHLIIDRSPIWRRIHWVVWGGGATLLLMPLVAMQFITEVDWTSSDFAAMGREQVNSG
ncbi:hypothetical protein N800_07895 [Lysobacter daejeonensis GH1-9]|uniref:Uncharacterized protein n=1 Tax=Lysobacter daejeonensis GH1-9 TaxID=1385517 RepID=A0A0A0EVY3_9GAMM|nr:hypothetical protein [Lysobacter daejeonensis]KGM53307.1 hypothetical protein N800_07895 [Lysobacter daejeonensis GH1-9]